MKIIIDLQSCQSGSRLGGIGRYSMQLSKAIIHEASGEDVWVLLNNQLPETIAEIRRELANSLPQSKIVSFESISRTNELASPSPFRTQSAELCRESFIAAMKPDFVFVTSFFEGLGDDVVTSFGNFASDHATAVTLYDLIPFVQKQKYLTDEIREAHYMRKFAQLTRADVLLAISEFSRDEGRQLLAYPQNRIINMSSAIGDFFRPIDISLTEKEDLLGKLRVHGKYLMYTGSFDQRKNHKNLIKAFSMIPRKVREDFQLLMVGNGWNGVYNDLKSYGLSCGLKESDLIFTGHINDVTLLKLYNLCHLFVFPSLFEGFGLPILEAMSCGIPSIGSNSTSIPEVIGRSDALFDPTSPASIAAKITQVLQTPSFYQSLKDHAPIQATKFSWEKSARIALDAFREFEGQTLNGDRRNRSTVGYGSISSGELRRKLINEIAALPSSAAASPDDQLELAGAIAMNERLLEIMTVAEQSPDRIDPKERLGIVSTWGTKCGIAAYSKLLMQGVPFKLSVFAPYSDLLLEPDKPFVHRCWSPGETDELIDLERKIEESGVTSVLFQVHYGFFNFDALTRLINTLRDNNIYSSIQLHSTADPAEHILPKKLKNLAAALNNCVNVFVLTKIDLERLNNIGVSNNVSLMPLGVNQVKPKEVAYARKVTDFVIASYGFFLPHKGLHELIRATAALKTAIPSLKLLLVNAEYPIPESRTLIQDAKAMAMELGIADALTIVSDYLADEESIGYLSKADLVVFPYQQTTEPSSASVRLGIASGVPVAVTPIDIFGDVGKIVHILPGMSVDDIVNGLLKLHNDIVAKKPSIEQVRRACDLWLKIHDYSNLSRYLYSRLAIATATMKGYRWQLHFSGNDPSLKTIIGLRNEHGIASNRKEGVLVFGPYISLSAGHYQLTIAGFSDVVNIWTAITLRLLHTDGLHVVDYEVRHAICSDSLIEVDFNLEKAIANFELQIISNGLHFVEIANIIFRRDRRIY